MHSFYTYAHARKTDGRIFYIGKGQGKRAHCERNRNRYWRNVVAKHGYDVQILCDWPTEDEAFDHEKLLISCFRDMGYELVNLTDGGEGASNPSPETRARITASLKAAWADPERRALHSEKIKIRTADPEYRTRLSAAIKNSTASPESRDRKSKAAKNKWADPEYRVRVRKAIESSLTDPKIRIKQSEATKAALADPEIRARMSKSMKKAFSSPEIRARRSEAVQGRIWVNNGIESKRVKPDVPMPEGFVLGRLPRKKV